MPTKPWETLTGLKNKDNTTKLCPLLKEPNKSSLMPWNPLSCKELKRPPPLSPKFLPTWLNTLNPNSRESLGTPSSTFCPKSPPMPPSKPTNPPSTELSLYVMNWSEKLPNQEKSKERIMNTGLTSILTPETPCPTKLPNWLLKSTN